jgi:hypothetical protein
MASAKTLAWIERLAWIGIYGGAFALILGIVSGEVHTIAGWSLGVLGCLAIVAGIVLIVVRSRLTETAPAGAQSHNAPEGKS